MSPIIASNASRLLKNMIYKRLEFKMGSVHLSALTMWLAGSFWSVNQQYLKHVRARYKIPKVGSARSQNVGRCLNLLYTKPEGDFIDLHVSWFK